MKVLVLCTGNSCRSIIAEALLNANGIEAYSSGVNPSGKVNPNAKRVLEENGIWNDKYYSKNLDEVMDIDFDLVVTVCDNAKETCPIFPKNIKTIHIPFSDPDGKDYDEFVKTYNEIKDKLLVVVSKILKKSIPCGLSRHIKKDIDVVRVIHNFPAFTDGNYCYILKKNDVIALNKEIATILEKHNIVKKVNIHENEKEDKKVLPIL